MRKNGFGVFLEFVGFLFLVVGIILGLFFFGPMENVPAILVGILMLGGYYILAGTFVLFLLFYGSGKIICLLADIEYNTRKK